MGDEERPCQAFGNCRAARHHPTSHLHVNNQLGFTSCLSSLQGWDRKEGLRQYEIFLLRNSPKRLMGTYLALKDSSGIKLQTWYIIGFGQKQIFLPRIMG